MKLRPGAIERFLDAPDARVRAVLVYGPDQGLVRERADRLARAVVPDAGDPFRIADIAATALREQPYLLADEAAAIAFGGGRRVVRLRELADGLAGPVESFVAEPAGDALVIAEAGDLGPRSRLRRLFEDAAAAAAIPCYPDTPETLDRLIRDELGAQGLSPSGDALAYLTGHLGGDRQLTRRELEKLVLYAGPGGGEVSLEDAVACVGDTAALGLDDLVFAVGDGDAAAAARVVARLFAEGVTPVAVLRAAIRHFDRLHRTAGLIAAGRPADQAMRGLAPPVFFRRTDQFRGQARRWKPAELAAALARLTEAEIQCKSTGVPAEPACAQALLELCRRRLRT